MLHVTPVYVEFGATRACFVTKQGQESINRKIRNLDNPNRRGVFIVFYERANRIASRDYNPIFDTDFASLVRYDRFPSRLYGSGATFLKFRLWYGGAASSYIPIFPVYIQFFDWICWVSRGSLWESKFHELTLIFINLHQFTSMLIYSH